MPGEDMLNDIETRSFGIRLGRELRDGSGRIHVFTPSAPAVDAVFLPPGLLDLSVEMAKEL
jgi:hypothetical protein